MPPAGPPPRGARRYFAGAGMALIVLAVLTVPRAFDRYRHGRYVKELAARKLTQARFGAYLATGACLRRDDGERWREALDAEDAPAAVRSAHGSERLTDRDCLAALAVLAEDASLIEDARAAFERWLTADRDLEHELDPGRTIAPARLRTKVAARDRAIADARKVASPVVQDALRKVQAEHSSRKDHVWWRLEIGLLVEDLLEAGFRAHASGKDVAAAIRGPLRQLAERMTAAHAELAAVREVRSLDLLERATGDAVWTTLRSLPNDTWSELAGDNLVFGEMPSPPEGCAPEL